jgi:O-antigen ligase
MIGIVVGYMILFLWRPFEIWPGLAPLRLELAYMLFALAATVARGVKTFRSPMHGAVIGFVAAVLASWLASPWRGSVDAWSTVEAWLKIVVFYLLVVLNVRTERDFYLLIIGFCFAVGMLMGHSLWEFHNGRHQFTMGIPRMLGVNKTFQHPNTFSATLVFALPFYLVAARHGTSRWVRWAGSAAILMVIYAVIRTGSRTALVGLAAASLAVMMQSQHRIRLALACLLLAAAGWNFTSAEVKLRFRSLVDDSVYESGEVSRSAQTSAEGRLEGLYAGWRLFREHPLTGVGPGAWIPATGATIESHNLYGQLAGELGLLGIVAFGYFVVRYGQSCRSLRGASLGEEKFDVFAAECGRSLFLALLLLLVMGMAGHSLYRFNWIWFAAFVATGLEIVRTRQRSGELRRDPTIAEDEDDAFVENMRTIGLDSGASVRKLVEAAEIRAGRSGA